MIVEELIDALRTIDPKKEIGATFRYPDNDSFIVVSLDLIRSVDCETNLVMHFAPLDFMRDILNLAKDVAEAEEAEGSEEDEEDLEDYGGLAS